MPARHDRPFSLPLTPAEFSAALRAGRGRAWMQVERFGARGIEDALVAAALHELAFDPQLNGDWHRSGWIGRMVVRAGLASRVMEALPELVRQPGPWRNDHDREHRARVLLELARAGVPCARELLHECLEPGNFTLGADEIVALDGAQGLVSVARRVGRWLERNDVEATEYPLLALDEQQGEGAGRRALEEASGDPDVARYLAALDAPAGTEPEPAARARPSAEEVIARVRAGDRGVWLGSWGRRVEPRELRLVHEALLAEPDPWVQRALLYAFSGVAPPYVSERLLAWADGDDELLAEGAAWALQHVADPRVRALALKRLRGRPPWIEPILMLRSNLRSGDALLLEGVVRRLFSSEQATHDGLWNVLEVCEANPSREVAGLLLILAWEHTPCAQCRTGALEQLLRLGAAPGWLLEEARHDADSCVLDVLESAADQGSV